MESYQGFSFRRKRQPLVLDNGVVNVEFAVSYRGRPPPIELPEHWVEPVARLIQELNLPIADAQAGVDQIKRFLDRIVHS